MLKYPKIKAPSGAFFVAKKVITYIPYLSNR